MAVMCRSAGAAALFMVLAVLCAPARAERLRVDLTDHLVAITTDFTGAKVVLFGVAEGDGDLIVTVRGPSENLTVRKKERIAGIWVNSDAARFRDVPSFYAVAATRPIAEFADEDILSRHRIGIEHLALPMAGTHPDDAAFRAALIRNKRRQGLYQTEPGQVTLLGDPLFRADLEFPANVTVGTYLVGVYMVRDNRVVGAETTPLIISKSGMSAEIFFVAHRYPVVYGIIAVLMAGLSGWLAGAVFRKR